MQPIRLVAFDLDGTLLTSNGRVAPRGALALCRAAQAGVHVVPATTRNANQVRAFVSEIGIAGPLICTNGAQVWSTPEGPLWASRCLAREVALAIARLADREGWELSTTVGAVTYWRQRPGQPLGPLNPNLTVVVANADAIVGEPLRILTGQPAAAEGILALCRSAFPEQCHTELYHNPDGSIHSLGVFAPGADKGTALALVLERLGLSSVEAMAIGDDLNDLAMFRHAALRVAMGNAVAEVKRCASVVAPANDEEGVAWALEQFVER